MMRAKLFNVAVLCLLSVGIEASQAVYPANATPVLWQLEDVVFTDGTSVTGISVPIASFDYDAETQQFTNINIRTYRSVSFPAGAEYTIFNYAQNLRNVSFSNIPAGPDLLVIDFASALTDAGGIIPLVAGGFELYAPPNSTTFRYIVSGELISATPLPTTLPLFATGLGVMGLFGWRRKCRGRA